MALKNDKSNEINLYFILSSSIDEINISRNFKILLIFLRILRKTKMFIIDQINISRNLQILLVFLKILRKTKRFIIDKLNNLILFLIFYVF